MTEMLYSAKHGTKRAGQKDLIKHLEGKRLTQRQAIKAKCYDCNGMGEQNSCDIEECPLLPYSPYKKKPATTCSKAPAEENEA